MSDDFSMMFTGVPENYPVVIYGNEVLRKKALPVHKIDSEVRKLVSRMRTVLTEAYGSGLAAPQIGVSLAVIVYMDYTQGEQPVVKALVNPEIVKFGSEMVDFDEGCLSLPGLRATVTLPDQIWVKGMDMNGRTIRFKAAGMTARVLQHEIDHLSGRLYIDIADPNSFYWITDTDDELSEPVEGEDVTAASV